jgi:hypothetical protein
MAVSHLPNAGSRHRLINRAARLFEIDTGRTLAPVPVCSSMVRGS